MKNVQHFTDKFAITLSIGCAIHCVALPFALILMPSLTALNLNNEAFHSWMLLIVIPSSLLGLGLGYRRHKSKQFIALGAFGLVLMICAVILGEELVSETIEKILTLFGAGLVAFSHWLNYKFSHK